MLVGFRDWALVVVVVDRVPDTPSASDGGGLGSNASLRTAPSRRISSAQE